MFRIISGERRYRAAGIVGLETLPCIIKEVDDEKRYLLQFIANLQREDITALEEAAGIRHIIEQYGYPQHKVARLFNKSKSYVSQILGLERLSEDAKQKIQTSELSKEVQIQASREKDPDKQLEILNKASEMGKTVKQIREEEKNQVSDYRKFRKWNWRPKNGHFNIIIQFNKEHDVDKKLELVRGALQKAIIQIDNSR